MRLLVLLLLAFAEISGAQTGDAIRLKRPLEWEFKSVSRLPGGLLNKTKSNARFAVPKSNSWQSIGPSRLQSSTYSYVSGRVSSLAVDPDDSNTVYCAAAGGGLWKSTDAGSSWTPLSDNLARLSSGSIAIDPSNPTTLYYGTGELNFNLDGYPGSGVYKSTDAGNTWTQLVLPGTIYYTGRIAIAPSNDAVVYVAGYAGVYRSTNSGTSWTDLNLADGAVDDIVVDPRSADTIYAAYGDAFYADSTNFGIFKSTNGGTSWSKLTSGLPPSSQVTRVSLAISRSDPDVLYAGLNGTNPANSSTDTNRVYTSTNGGVSWSVLPAVSTTSDFGGGQGWYNNIIAVDPSNSSIVYLGGIDLWKSTNAGETWTNLTNAYGTPNGKNIHPDQHAIAFGGSGGNFIYLGNDGGVWRTSDGGSTFIDCNTNISTIQFYGMDADQKAPSNTVGGTQDNGTEEGTEPSLVWNEIYGGDGGYTIVDPTDSNLIYGEYVYGAFVKSTDAGASFSSITSGIGESGYWISPYALVPHNTATIFAATSKIYRSTNSGTNWTARTGYLKSSSDLITTLSISPPETNVMYAGISGYRGASGTAYLFVSTNNGSNWTNVTTHLPSGCDFCRVTADPTQKGVAYLAVLSGSEHVLKTTDYGSSWTALSSTSNGFDDVPTKIMCVDSLNGYILAGTYWGVYLSTDDGSTWSKFSSGLPNAVVDDIAIQYSTDELRIGTHGRGVWAFSLQDYSLSVQAASFTTVQSNQGIELKWSTQSEVRSAGFNILREASGENIWELVASYNSDDSLRGLGTASTGKDYTYKDGKVTFGETYRYKLQSVSDEGTVSDVSIVSTTFDVPSQYVLYQNYPNPFNPGTTIRFDLNEQSTVSLDIYNVLGQRVIRNNYGTMNAGRYNEVVNMDRFASGVYFYRIAAQGNDGQKFVSIKKLVLMK